MNDYNLIYFCHLNNEKEFIAEFNNGLSIHGDISGCNLLFVYEKKSCRLKLEEYLASLCLVSDNGVYIPQKETIFRRILLPNLLSDENFNYIKDKCETSTVFRTKSLDNFQAQTIEVQFTPSVRKSLFDKYGNDDLIIYNDLIEE